MTNWLNIFTAKCQKQNTTKLYCKAYMSFTTNCAMASIRYKFTFVTQHKISPESTVHYQSKFTVNFTPANYINCICRRENANI